MIPAMSRRNFLRRTRSNERGATMLEMAIALPVLFVIVLGMMDISIRFMAQGTLNHAALHALNMASKLPGIDNWTEGVPDNGASINGFNLAMQQIEDETLRYVSASLIEPASVGSDSGWIQFLGATRQVGGDEIQSTLLLLRPAETGAFVSSDGTADAVVHPTLQTGDGNQVQLLKSHPLYIELRAVQHPVLWFLPDMEIRAIATGFREINSANIRAATLAFNADVEPEPSGDPDPIPDEPEEEPEEPSGCIRDMGRCLRITSLPRAVNPHPGYSLCPHPSILDEFEPPFCECVPCAIAIAATTH